MNDDDLERGLHAAFEAAALSAVPDAAVPPPPRFAAAAAAPAARRSPRRLRLFAPLAASAAVVAVVVAALALPGDGSGGGHGRPAAAATTTATTATATEVRIRIATAGGATYGVGMPVVAYFSRRFTDAGALAAATSITVNGAPARGAWYFEPSAVPGFPVQGHLRLRTFWPADSRVAVTLGTRGVSGGRGYAFANDATVAFRTGPRVVAVVDDRTHRLTVTRDGTQLLSYPVSLGASATPTSRGTKVIMQKRPSVCLTGPGFRECGVKYAQQLTYSGEYLHAAPWNDSNIEHGIDTSNGCTNLLPGDAQVLYRLLRVGDVVEYPDASGPAMRMDAGYGDWNVPWPVWLRGGLIPTS